MNFTTFLEDLKNVNPNTPGSWPLPIKLSAFLLMFIAIVGAGAFFDWQDEWASLTSIRDQEVKLKETYLVKKKQAVNLDLIKKQLIETQQSFGALLKQLPTKSEMAALLTDINQAGLGRGLLFDLFKPGNEVPTGVFTEQPITVKVTGTYDDLGKFASDISMMPRIVTLTGISITPTTQGLLTMDATAKTYRYLEDTEISTKNKPVGAKK
jgi:type IV pilus assembly protein PilO